jgi:hypothetical protein
LWVAGSNRLPKKKSLEIQGLFDIFFQNIILGDNKLAIATATFRLLTSDRQRQTEQGGSKTCLYGYFFSVVDSLCGSGQAPLFFQLSILLASELL